MVPKVSDRGIEMPEVKDLTMNDLEYLIKQKILEMLRDLDSTLALTDEFKKELKERLGKPSKRIPYEELLKKFGQG